MDAYRQENPTEQRPATAYPFVAALFAVLAGTACMALLPRSPFALLLYPPAAALMAFVLCGFSRNGKPALGALLPMLPAVVTAACISETFGVAVIARMALLPFTALAIWLVQRRRKGGFLTASTAAAVSIVCLYAMVCLPGILDGTGAFTAVQERASGFASLLQAQLEPLRAYPEYREILSLYDRLFEALPLSVPALTTGMLCSLGGAGGLLATVLFFALTRKRRAALGLAAPKPFRLWSIPRQYTPGLVLLYAVAVLLQLFSYINADAVYNTVCALLGIPLLTQGLSMIAFLLSRRRYPSRSLNAVIFVLIGALFPLASSMLSTIGVLEQLFRFRERELPPVAPRRGA